MAKVRLNRREIKEIQDAADRLARRSNGRFVIDPTRLEIVEAEDDEASKEAITNSKHVINFR